MSGADAAGRALRDLSFLHMVPTIRAAPAAAHADALDLFEHGERLGYDSAWVFARHLQRGLSSPVGFLGAASQRTWRLGLGAAVIPLEFERLLTLAEGLATVDVLSGGRVQAGLSTHEPRFADADNDLVHGAGWRAEDYSHERLARLRALVRDDTPLVPDDPFRGPGTLWSGRAEPVAPGLGDRLWQGGGSLRSVQWAGDHGFPLLLSNVATSIDGGGDYAENHRRLVEAYRERAGEAARVKVGLVVVPASGASAAQRERYDAYLRPRAERPGSVGPQGMILAPDLHGDTAAIVDALGSYLDRVDVHEFMAILPFTFDRPDYEQIVAVVAQEIAPQLGWRAARA